jgi:hypothetical protein
VATGRFARRPGQPARTSGHRARDRRGLDGRARVVRGRRPPTGGRSGLTEITYEGWCAMHQLLPTMFVELIVFVQRGLEGLLSQPTWRRMCHWSAAPPITSPINAMAGDCAREGQLGAHDSIRAGHRGRKWPAGVDGSAYDPAECRRQEVCGVGGGRVRRCRVGSGDHRAPRRTCVLSSLKNGSLGVGDCVGQLFQAEGGEAVARCPVSIDLRHLGHPDLQRLMIFETWYWPGVSKIMRQPGANGHRY